LVVVLMSAGYARRLVGHADTVAAVDASPEVWLAPSWTITTSA
jgi:hypothetical protein